jgi:phage terminase large subunit-like protein
LKNPYRCGPIPKLREWRGLPYDDLTRAEQAMYFVERNCVIPEGALVGQKVKLADFQEAFLYSVYDNVAITRRALFSIARKNAKSATIAFILLVHLVGPEAKLNSQIVSGAMSRDQAALVFSLASKMVQLSPSLQKRVSILPSGKRLVGRELNVEYRALSAEAKTAHGLSPVLAILDEIGQIVGPQSDFIDAITTSQGAHANPLLIALSTQAASDADLLSIWLDDAEASGDPRIVSHLYCADENAELDDKQAWADANPALGLFRSLPDLEEQMKQAARMPSMENTVRNLLLNQRVSVNSPFISRDVWKANAAIPLPFDRHTPVYGGLDLSARTDLTALVLVGKVAGIWQVHTYVWTPEDGLKDRSHKDRSPYDVWAKQGYIRTTPGKTVDYEYVARDIAEICYGLSIHSIAFDRWRIDLLKKEFADIGIDTELPAAEGGLLPLVEFGQGFMSISPAMDVLEEWLLNSQVAHGMHPVLTMCAANGVVVKDPAGNRKLDKQKATGRIDGIVALVMAAGAVVLAAGNEDVGVPMVY